MVRLLVLGFCLLWIAGLALADDTSTYRLAPQDTFSVAVLRHAELSGQFTVPPDGVIDFPRAGRMNVLNQTTQELASALKTAYDTFLVNAEVTVVLVTVRERYAYALGAVSKPGQYAITTGARITELLASAGDVVGERRELTAKLIRGQTAIPLNVQAIFDGKDSAANLPVQEGDLLWVEAPPKITVVVSGQVKNPGAVKLRQGSTVVDAVAQAGDLTDRPERITVMLLRAGQRETVAWNDAAKVLQEGDLLTAEQEVLTRVYINGHIRNPGAYELPPGGGVLEVIALSGGLLANPSLQDVTIVRCAGGSEKLDLTAAIRDGNVTMNPKLGAGDLVIVPECTAKIAVLGYVGKPGTFPINPTEPMTVTDAIGLAGGCLPKSRQSDIAVVRKVNGAPQRIKVDLKAIINQKKPEMNITLQPGDIVYVPESSLQSIETLIPLLGIFL